MHKLPALAKLVFQMGFKTSDDAHDHLGLKYMGKDAARDFLFCIAAIIREWINIQARNSPMVGPGGHHGGRWWRIGKQRKYETRYPGERPVDHDLRSEEYGPGGWTDEQQQIWFVIVKDSR